MTWERVLNALCAFIMFSLVSCGGSTGLQQQPAEPAGSLQDIEPQFEPGLAGHLAVPFPDADDLSAGESTRAGSSTDVQVLNGSERYRKSDNAANNGNFLDLNAGPGETSWGMYRFDSLVDEDLPQSLDIEFTEPMPATYYIGLADFDTRAWQWHRVGSSHTTSTSEHDILDLPVGPKYISANGYVFAVVLVYDDVSDIIYSISLTSEIHDEAPFAECFITPTRGNAALSVDFDATTSFDKGGGGIEAYWWDWEGDGVVNVIGLLPTYTHIYAERGEYAPIVTVVDTDGLRDEVQLGVVVSGWIHSWGQSDNDIIYGLDIDDEGDVYAVGYHSNGFAQGSGLLIAKYDRFGEPIWQKTWVTDESETLRAVWHLADGSLLAVGTTQSVGEGSGDLLFLKFNSQGEALGAWSWGGEFHDTARDLQVDVDGNIYITGTTTSFGENNGPNVLTMKLDSEMNVLWARSWGPDYPDRGYKIRIDGYGNAYVLVRSESFDSPQAECVLLKYDPDGALLWSQRYYMGSHISVVGMDLDWAGNAYIVGDDASVDSKLLLLKFDGDGNLLLQKTWDAGYRAMGADILVSGGFMIPITLRITGNTYSATSDKDLLYLKMNGNAVTEIEKTLVAPGYQDGECLTRGRSGEVLIGGWAENNSGVWLDVPGTVANASGTLVNAIAGTAFINNTSVTSQSVNLSNVVGVHDTGGGGVWDAVAMSYFEDDM